MKKNFLQKVVTVLSLIGGLSLLTSCGVEQVDTGYVGIETKFGEVVGQPLQSGLHFYNPFTSSITEFAVRQETWENKSAIFTKDNQRVDITFAVTYSPDAAAVTSIFKEVGRESELANKIIRPTVLGILQNEIGKIVADDVNQKKTEIANITRDALKEALAAKHVTVYDMQFVDTDFNDTYEHAAEQKVVALQKAAQAKNETVQIEEKAKQTVVAAQAQATAMKIQSEALSKNQNLVQYELAKKWDGKLPQYQFGNAGTIIDLKNLGK